MPSVTISQAGIYFNGKEEILSIECLNGGNHIVAYYDIQNTGNPKVAFLNRWNDTDKTFERIDVRTLNSINSFRVTFNDGYKSWSSHLTSKNKLKILQKSIDKNKW